MSKKQLGKPSKSAKNFYLAYIDKKGKRVKRGTRGSRPIEVKINRVALVEAAKKAGRIGGKFAPKLKAIAHKKRVLAAKKGAATRAMKKYGAYRERDFTTKSTSTEFSVYVVPFMAGEVLQATHNRARLDGWEYLFVKIHAKDTDGDELFFHTGYFRITNENIPAILDAVSALEDKYEIAEVVEYEIYYTKGRTI